MPGSENNGIIFLVAWTGGYEEPSFFFTPDREAADARFFAWRADAAQSDWLSIVQYDLDTGVTEVVMTKS